MSHFSRKVLFFAAVAVIFSGQLKPAGALRCFQCSRYDRVENQCSPEVDMNGESIECTGPHPVCELIVETYSRIPFFMEIFITCENADNNPI
ncbi:hypothetical protein Ocin01_15980 [Orchesella cincta]|uniref:Protein quiver n=1 Tax=Orchesella cincta TaxID=48709 RepID=A0A1D2MCR0_ORCCI|nr:hypothetical protein Ocin01_15980 [Orchesella cincta]